MRIAIFIAVFMLVFGFTTCTNQRGGLGFGGHSFTSYGWPQPWLRIHTITKSTVIQSDGTKQGGERTTERSVDVGAFMVSAGAAGGIAAVLSAPLFFWPLRKSDRV